MRLGRSLAANIISTVLDGNHVLSIELEYGYSKSLSFRVCRRQTIPSQQKLRKSSFVKMLGKRGLAEHIFQPAQKISNSWTLKMDKVYEDVESENRARSPTMNINGAGYRLQYAILIKVYQANE